MPNSKTTEHLSSCASLLTYQRFCDCRYKERLNEENKNLSTETHEKVVAFPVEFCVSCPDCGGAQMVDLVEQDDGGFEPEISEKFIQCLCGKFIEVTGRWRNLP